VPKVEDAIFVDGGLGGIEIRADEMNHKGIKEPVQKFR
jgi:hypothetical protein